MPRRKIGVGRFQFELSDAEALELTLGTGGRPSHFASDEERRAAWQAHRSRLLEETSPGKRPWGWWRFDSPQPWGHWCWERSGTPCVPVHQAIELVAMGVVGPEEMQKIEDRWAAQDAQAHEAAANAVAVNKVKFGAALEANRRLRGVPLDRPELAKEVPE